MTDYSELKRLAEAATGGDWEYRLGMVRSLPDSDGYVLIAVAPNSPKNWRGQRDANMGFIAAAKPSAVLALIADLKKIEADRRACWAEFKVMGRHVDQLKAENEALRKDAERYQWLRDEADFSDFEALCHTAIDGWAAYIDGCETCQGSGEIDQTLGGEWNSGIVPCPDCDGRGR